MTPSTEAPSRAYARARTREKRPQSARDRRRARRRPANADALRVILGPFGAIPRRTEWGRYSVRCNGPVLRPLRWQRFFDLR